MQPWHVHVNMNIWPCWDMKMSSYTMKCHELEVKSKNGHDDDVQSCVVQLSLFWSKPVTSWLHSPSSGWISVQQSSWALHVHEWVFTTPLSLTNLILGENLDTFSWQWLNCLSLSWGGALSFTIHPFGPSLCTCGCRFCDCSTIVLVLVPSLSPGFKSFIGCWCS